MTRQRLRRIAMHRHQAGQSARAPKCEQCKETDATVIRIVTHAGVVWNCRDCRIEHARMRQSTLAAVFLDMHGFSPSPDQLAAFDREARDLDRLAQEGLNRP